VALLGDRGPDAVHEVPRPLVTTTVLVDLGELVAHTRQVLLRDLHLHQQPAEQEDPPSTFGRKSIVIGVTDVVRFRAEVHLVEQFHDELMRRPLDLFVAHVTPPIVSCSATQYHSKSRPACQTNEGRKNRKEP